MPKHPKIAYVITICAREQRKVAWPRKLRAFASASSEMATETATTKMYGGHNRTFTHPSSACACDMKFTVFVPPTASESSKVPVRTRLLAPSALSSLVPSRFARAFFFGGWLGVWNETSDHCLMGDSGSSIPGTRSSRRHIANLLDNV